MPPADQRQQYRTPSKVLLGILNAQHSRHSARSTAIASVNPPAGIPLRDSRTPVRGPLRWTPRCEASRTVVLPCATRHNDLELLPRSGQSHIMRSPARRLTLGSILMPRVQREQGVYPSNRQEISKALFTVASEPLRRVHRLATRGPTLGLLSPPARGITHPLQHPRPSGVPPVLNRGSCAAMVCQTNLFIHRRVSILGMRLPVPAIRGRRLAREVGSFAPCRSPGNRLCGIEHTRCAAPGWSETQCGGNPSPWLWHIRPDPWACR